MPQSSVPTSSEKSLDLTEEEKVYDKALKDDKTGELKKVRTDFDIVI